MAHHHPHLSSAQLAKRDAVEEIKKQIEESQSFVIIDYKGLTVAQDTEFRAEFRKNLGPFAILLTVAMLLTCLALELYRNIGDFSGDARAARAADDAQTVSLSLEDAVSIMQAAYDRYLKR